MVCHGFDIDVREALLRFGSPTPTLSDADASAAAVCNLGGRKSVEKIPSPNEARTARPGMEQERGGFVIALMSTSGKGGMASCTCSCIRTLELHTAHLGLP